MESNKYEEVLTLKKHVALCRTVCSTANISILGSHDQSIVNKYV